jgi:uncharacterized peroxidase-related enzyme
MARLPYATREQLPESDRTLFEEINAQFGRVNNIFRMLAHHPLLLRRLLHLSDGLRHATRLDPRLRELAILTVGRLTHSEYEMVHHSALAPRLGVRPEQIAQLAAWESDPAFTEQERAVIRYAAEATQSVAVADATFDALRSFLDQEQILELVLNVAFYNMVVRVLLPLEIDLEPDAHENRYNLAHDAQKEQHS